MLISFAWTTPALLAGAKTMTRRDWTPEHAAKFHDGQLVDAWNQTPRVNSVRRGIAIARKVATIRITRDPWQQMSDEALMSDYVAEGFAWLRDHGHAIQVQRIIEDWELAPRSLWVVQFQLVEVVA